MPWVLKTLLPGQSLKSAGETNNWWGNFTKEIASVRQYKDKVELDYPKGRVIGPYDGLGMTNAWTVEVTYVKWEEITNKPEWGELSP